MKAAKITVKFDYSRATEARRWLCREHGEHMFPEAAIKDGVLQPGRYACTVCGTIKIVKEALL